MNAAPTEAVAPALPGLVAGSESNAQRSTRPPVDDDLPDWLRDIQAFQQESPQPLPLPGSRDDASESRPASSQPYELPPWLRADFGDQPTPQGGNTTPDAPSWLANDADNMDRPAWAAPDDAATTEATWLDGTPDPAAPAPPTTPPATPSSIPSWLIASPHGAEAAPPQTTSSDRTPEALPPTAPAVPEQATRGSDAPPPEQADAASVSAAAAGSNLPRWLLDDDEDDLPLPQSPQGLATPVADDGLPPWLREPAPPPAVDDAAPSWTQTDLPAQSQSSTQSAPSGDDAQPETPATTLPSVTATPQPASTGLPDWLQDTQQSPPDSVTSPEQGAPWLGASPQQPTSSPLPAWLSEDESPPAAPSPNAAPAATSGSELPSWLQDTQQTQRPTAAPTTDEQPDWLDMLGQSTTAADAPSLSQGSDVAGRADRSVSATPQPNLPDWLKPTPEEEAAQHAQPPAPAQDDVPEWLRDFTSTQPAPSISQGGEPRPVDQWLTDTGPEPPSIAALPIPASSESRARIYNVRDEDVEVEANVPREAAQPLPSWLVGQDGQTGDPPWALPPWLSEANGAPPPAQTVVVPTSNAVTTQSALPAWLQEDDAPPTTAAPSWLHIEEPVAATEPQPSTQPTQGVDSAPAQPEQPASVQRTLELPVAPTPERAESSSVLERLVAEPEPEPVAVPATPRRPSLWSSMIMPIIVTLLIVAAIVYVMLGPGLPRIFGGIMVPATASAAPMLVDAQTSAAVTGWHAQIEQLAPQVPVLVVYAYDGSRSAEISALEAAIMDDLRDRPSPLLLIATDPEGAFLSRQRAASAGPNAASPVLDLGYKPGGPLALARIAHNPASLFEQDASGQDRRGDIATFCNAARCSLADLGMVVVLSDDANDARGAVEQLASVRPDLPFVFATSAENAPAVRPYLVSARMTLLAGLSDAAMLDTTRGDTLARQRDAVAAGGAVWGLLALLGAVPAATTGWLRRRNGQGRAWDR